MILEHNKAMQDKLAQYGIKCRAKRIDKGSLKGSWRLYNPEIKWSQELADRFNSLGFMDFDGKPLGIYSGNGGYFAIFVRELK